MLRVVVECAKTLPKKSVGSPDPVVSVTFKDVKKKTKTIKNEVNPVWNEVFEFDLKGTPLDSSSFVNVVVKDYETLGKDKFLGSTRISLKNLAEGQSTSLPSKNVPLATESGQSTGATIDLVIAYDPPPNAAPGPQAIGDATLDGGGGGGGGEEETDAGPPGAPGGSGGRPAFRRRNRNSRSHLANKPQDFQIRARVIEGRQLPGNHVKPVVKLNVCGQTHRTRIRTGNNPYFDEVFFYNVHMLPSELFDQNINIRVYNSYSLRADALMGEFMVDVGYIYDEPAHCVLRKWLLLSDPDDSSSGARGYLKVSIFIVGVGDEPPADTGEAGGEEDDIESNLLLPAGLALRQATLALKVFRAEDIPQMDDSYLQAMKGIFGETDGKKNLVDPFLEASFAGKKLRTIVMEKNANPEWNQTLSLQVKFPSMCECIKLSILDWDRLTHNDTIGTTHLNLARIASSGGEIEDEHPGNGDSNTGEAEVGFLPAFGPCYINLYGSPREFSGLPDPYEDLNYGKGEGVAYRGRVLVQLSTQLDGKVDKAVDSIVSDDILVAQKYQRRRKYGLCVVFHASSMIQDPGEPIQFEVSIGNYGNKLDSTCKPLASTTQYSSAVFDGNHYYYLPWSATKPVVVLTSFWEDISHRLDTVNIILFIARRLEFNLELLKNAIGSKASDRVQVEAWVKLLTQLLEDLESHPLPELAGQAHLTSLDLQLRKLRDSGMESVGRAARAMREGNKEIPDCVADIEGWAEKLTQMAEEPQNSMPDVIIWMLRGEKRVAYSRVPAHKVLFSTYSQQACGQHCGQTQTIFMQYPMDKNNGLKVPVQIRVNMWLGLSSEEKKFNSFTEGTFSVFAELYENQAQMFGKWGTHGLVGRHKFSDMTGKIKLKKEYFLPPRGWEWEGEWFIDPERSLLTEADAGHTEFMDEVFQNQSRYPGGEWKPADEPYTDVNGEKNCSPDELTVPDGWIPEDGWGYDMNRAVDEQGWEYGVTIPPDDKPRSWAAVEKMYHVHRRRRMVRLRRRAEPPAGGAAEKRDSGDPEGWEFSSLIGWNFHRKERTSDTFRRRRWRRKMAPEGRLGAAAIFKLEGALGVNTEEEKDSDSTKAFGANTPTVSCSFDSPSLYHLRVYVYQARGMASKDKDSFSDPYTHVSFLHVSRTTEKLKSTLNPTWDQTLIFDDLEIYGDPQSLARSPPNVVLEFYDHDQVGKDELLGRTVFSPLVELSSTRDQNPKLLWYPILLKGQRAGEALLAAELILKDKNASLDLPLVPPMRGLNLYMVPQGIRPVVQLTAVEILVWGLRNMKSYELAAVSSPSLVVEVGGQRVESAVIRNMKKSPNFPSSVLFIKVHLPKDEMYTPPIVLKVIDHRPFGRKPVVGRCTVTSLERFRCDPNVITAEGCMANKMSLMMSSPHLSISMDEDRPLLETQVQEKEKETVDWWSKFYASMGDRERCGEYTKKGYDTLQVYTKELEDVHEFNGLTDFCDTFKLERGKKQSEKEDPDVVGEFKGSFRVYPLSDDPGVMAPPRQFRELPDSGPQECLVRVYIIRALDLQPKDNNGRCDPYMKLSLGRNSVDDSDNYIPNTTNPVFGKMFEMSCYLPQEKDLKIAVYDYDLLTRDEKVGETVIDLENRFLSRYNSYCGLPQTYCISGVNQWRDHMKPSQILDNVARLKGLSKPRTEDNGNTLTFQGQEYTLAEFEANTEVHQHLGPARERMCLHVLRTQGLVPEHVETRTLYSSFQPTLSQGRLQMWVDVFPKSIGPPGPPFDVTPRKAKKNILRVVIWNTTDVTLDETSITGEHMSDIYVKGWMPGMEDDKQKTDVHYRSLDGDGNFNWRFIFNFEYLPAEELCLVSKKENFWSLDKSEFRIPPKFIVQIWDNDKFSLDDYLGVVELDLRALVPPAKTPEKCGLEMLEGGHDKRKSEQTKSLFAQQSVRGWWPCSIEKDGRKELGGKVEMTLEIVGEADADEKPAGKGRDEPNMNPRLEPPNRPDTSFFWFTNPCKTMKFIVWRRFRCLFIGLIILLVLGLFLCIFLYSLPNYISMKIIKPLS